MYGDLKGYTLCGMMISLDFEGLHIVCDDDKFGKLEVRKFTCCV